MQIPPLFMNIKYDTANITRGTAAEAVEVILIELHAGMPKGIPQNRRFCGKRRRSGMDETRRLRRGEGYGACADEVERVTCHTIAIDFQPVVFGGLSDCDRRFDGFIDRHGVIPL